MSAAFPGAIYDGDGRSLHASGRPNLTQAALDECAHSSLVTLGDHASQVGRVWLLDDGARFASIPAAELTEAIRLLFAGQGIAIVARCAEAEADVRAGLGNALDLARASHEAAGHA